MNTNKEIWIIDDHALFNAGLKQLLESMVNNMAIRCFDHPAKASVPDTGSVVSLIIMDFYIPGVDVLAWITQFHQCFANAPLIVISSSTSLTDKQNCLDAGAAAYFPKHSPPDITLKSLKEFIDGKKTPADTAIGLQTYPHPLTNRQAEILIQLARGHSNKKIARLLEVSPETVKTHLAVIYKTIECNNRDEAIDWARARGLV